MSTRKTPHQSVRIALGGDQMQFVGEYLMRKLVSYNYSYILFVAICGDKRVIEQGAHPVGY